MTKIEFRNLVFENKNAKYNNPFELKKMNELCEVLDKEECELIALDIAVNLKGQLNLSVLLVFVKNAFFLNANSKAKQTKIEGGEFPTKYEEIQALRAYYFKKSLKKLPEWAQKTILGGKNDE